MSDLLTFKKVEIADRLKALFLVLCLAIWNNNNNLAMYFLTPIAVLVLFYILYVQSLMITLNSSKKLIKELGTVVLYIRKDTEKDLRKITIMHMIPDLLILGLMLTTAYSVDLQLLFSSIATNTIMDVSNIKDFLILLVSTEICLILSSWNIVRNNIRHKSTFSQ